MAAGMWECSPDQTDSKPRCSSSRAGSARVIEYSVKKSEIPNFLVDGSSGSRQRIAGEFWLDKIATK
jgi:hypothetical protein